MSTSAAGSRRDTRLEARAARASGCAALLALVSACAPSPALRIEGTEPGDCSDAADNDGDGRFDCDDASCADSPTCRALDSGVEPADADLDASARLDAPAPSDASRADGGVLLPIVTNGTAADPMREPARYDCLGARTAPRPGGVSSLGLELRGFESGDAITYARAQVFPDNRLAATCSGGCVELTTDAMGDGTVSAPAGGWLTVRVFPRPGATMVSTYVDTTEANVLAPPSTSGVVSVRAVSISTLNLIVAFYGLTRAPTTATALGAVRDCDGELVRGAVVRIFGADGTELGVTPGVADAREIGYFDGARSPDRTREHTEVDGLYAGVNLPAPSSGMSDIRVEAWGVRSAAGPIERLGCEVVPIGRDGVSIIDVGPLRSDYDVRHPCRAAGP